jgi:hypothetical protein
VAVLESRAIGAGMSCRSAGTLSEWPAGVGGYNRLAGRLGAGAARQVAASRAEAFEWVQKTVREEGIACRLAEAAGCAALLSGGANSIAAADALGEVTRAGVPL